MKHTQKKADIRLHPKSLLPWRPVTANDISSYWLKRNEAEEVLIILKGDAGDNGLHPVGICDRMRLYD